MLLYYQSWMFYNHFIVILYHFLVLTYWHSAKCQFLFFHVFYIAWNQMESKCPETIFVIFYGPEGRQWALVAPGKCPEGGTIHQGAPGGPGAPWWVVPTLGAPRTASLLYKYPKNTRTLGESTEYSSSRRRVQNHQIQSRHHHGGVHHFHWCLSDDAWVVLCRPSGP